MTKAFDEEFGKTIEKMKEHLLSNRMKMISFTFTDGFSFKLSISEKKYQKLIKKRTLEKI